MSAVAVLLCSLACALADVTPVSSVNVTQYLGRWYQVYDDLFEKATFENSSYCATADYGLLSNHSVSVLNSERQYSVTGPQRNITGYAFAPNPSEPGKLEVHLDGVPVGAPYWIIELGPVVGDVYDYAVVSDGTEVSLFVLCRNVERYFQKYDQQLLTKLKNLGFDQFYNTPTPIQQQGCQYN